MPGLNLQATISLDGSQFERGMNRIGSSVANGIKNFVVGAVGLYAIQAALRKTIDTADELVNSSLKLSMTTEQLQLLQRAAENNGKTFDLMTLALERFNAARENILNKGPQWQNQMLAMQRLGLTSQTLANQTAATSFMNQISATAQRSNAADIAMDMRTIFGRNAMEFFGILQTNFSDLEKKMKSMGAIMDTTTAVELRTFKNEMGLIGQIITSQLAPWLVYLGEKAFKLAEVFQVAGAFYGTLMADWAHGIFKGSLDDAREEGHKVMVSFDTTWSEFQKQMKAMADAINNPNPEATVGKPAPEKEKKERALKDESNALIKVGNFLGASRDTIGNLQQQTAQHAAATATNTKVSADTLKAIHSFVTTLGNKPGAFQLHEETIFPTG